MPAGQVSNNSFFHIHLVDLDLSIGLWAFEMAQVLPPDSRIISIDLVPPTNERSGLPTQSIPANVTYKRGDILVPLDFADQQFDYVYQRDVAHIVPMKHWPSLIREFHRVLRPGGKLELVEYGKHTGCLWIFWDV